MLGGWVGPRPVFPRERISEIVPVAAVTGIRRAFGEFLMLQNDKDKTTSIADRRKALERVAAQIDQTIKTLSSDKLGEELVEGLKLGGAPHPVKCLVEISAAAGWYLDNLAPPRRGPPFQDAKTRFVERVAVCLSDAGVPLTATRATENRRGSSGKDGVFVGTLRILFEAAGERGDPHGLAEIAIKERRLAVANSST